MFLANSNKKGYIPKLQKTLGRPTSPLQKAISFGEAQALCELKGT